MNDLLRAAQDCLRIHSVQLKESKVFVNDDFEPDEFGAVKSITQEFSGVGKIKESSITDVSTKEDAWHYQFRYLVGIRAIRKEDELKTDVEGFKPLVEIYADFSACYVSATKLPSEQASAFATDNVGFNVWPYWREYVQSSCNRIGLNPILSVPLSRRHQKSMEREQEHLNSQPQ